MSWSKVIITGGIAGSGSNIKGKVVLIREIGIFYDVKGYYRGLPKPWLEFTKSNKIANILFGLQ